MKIELNEITIKRLFDGFVDNAESGVVAYGAISIQPSFLQGR